MILHKKTLAVSTAALVMTGGAAYAFINATTVTGGGSVATKTVSTSVKLYTETGLQLDPLHDPAPGSVADVFADNSSNVSFLLPVVTVGIDTSSFPPNCPTDSFSASYAPNDPTSTTVLAKAAGQKVGKVTVTFKDEPLADQNGCNGLALTLTFSQV